MLPVFILAYPMSPDQGSLESVTFGLVHGIFIFPDGAFIMAAANCGSAGRGKPFFGLRAHLVEALGADQFNATVIRKPPLIVPPDDGAMPGLPQRIQRHPDHSQGYDTRPDP